MKPNIHPTWYPEAVVTCACGNTWTTGSTKKEIHTDVCSKCHPFFTGEQRIVDTAGQVERFMKRISAKEQIAASQPGLEEKKSKKEKRRGRKAAVEPEAEAPQPPAELPLAVAEERPAPPTRAPRARRPAAPEPGVEEVAPIVEPEQFQAGKNEEIAPAGEIGQVASIDKIVEPTGELGSETQAESGESPEPEEAPRGTESSDHVHDVEKPGEGGA